MSVIALPPAHLRGWVRRVEVGTYRDIWERVYVCVAERWAGGGQWRSDEEGKLKMVTSNPQETKSKWHVLPNLIPRVNMDLFRIKY